MAAKSKSKATGYTVDAGALAAHLKVLSMKGRIEQARFGKDFSIVVSDVDDEIAVKATSKIEFPVEFAVGDLKQFAKIIGYFNTEVEMSFDGDHLVIDQNGSKFKYQCAALDTILEAPDFASHEEHLIGDTPLTVVVGATAAIDLDGFRKLIEADLIQFTIEEGTVRAQQISNATMHETDSLLGEIENDRVFKSHEKAMEDFKISGAVLRDMMDGIQMDPNDEDDVIMFDFGEALRVRYDGGNYVFLISTQVPVDGVGETEGEE